MFKQTMETEHGAQGRAHTQHNRLTFSRGNCCSSGSKTTDYTDVRKWILTPTSHPVHENQNVWIRDLNGQRQKLLGENTGSILMTWNMLRPGGQDAKCTDSTSKKGIPQVSRGKESTCQHRRCKRCGFSSWVGKFPLEKETAAYSSILAWESPRTEEPGRLQLDKASDTTQQINNKQQQK